MTVKKKEILRGFLEKYPWLLLREIIHKSPSLTKTLTSGGVRIISKNRTLILPKLVKRCLEDPSFQEMLFIAWFNSSKYDELLHDFFKSEEHKELLQKRGIEENCYVINEHFFKQFIELITPNDIDIFLNLSPIIFTPDQQATMRAVKNRSIEVPVSTGLNKTENKKSDPSNNSYDNINKGQNKFYKKELKKRDDKILKLEKIRQKLTDKLNNLKSGNNENKDRLKELSKNYEIEIDTLFKEKQELNEKLSCAHNEINKLRKKSEDDNNRIKNLEKKLANIIEERERPFYEIISKVDGDDLLARINAPDDVLELLGTIIRPMQTDAQQTHDNQYKSLDVFWQDLIAKEKELADNIFTLGVCSVSDGSLVHKLPEIKDDFIDLKCSLSTRIFLAEMLYNILNQYVQKYKF